MGTNGDQYQRIGHILRDARKRSGLRQQDVADALRRTKPSISQIENGRHRAPIDVLQRFGELVGVDVVILTDQGGPQHQLAIRLARLPALSPEAAASLSALLSVWEEQHRAAAIVGERAV